MMELKLLYNETELKCMFLSVNEGTFFFLVNNFQTYTFYLQFTAMQYLVILYYITCYSIALKFTGCNVIKWKNQQVNTCLQKMLVS